MSDETIVPQDHIEVDDELMAAYLSGVDDAAMLGKLARSGVRRAQGLVIGRAASAAETYDTHLAFR